jgi:hypothetical protein
LTIDRKEEIESNNQGNWNVSFRTCDVYEEDILIPLVIRYQYIIMHFIEISLKHPAIGLDLHVIHVKMSSFTLNRVAESFLCFFKYPL